MSRLGDVVQELSHKMRLFFENEAEKVRRSASESSGKRKSRSNSGTRPTPERRGRSVPGDGKGKKSTTVIPITKSLSPEQRKKGAQIAKSLAAQIGNLRRELDVQGDAMKITEAAIAPPNKETVSQKQALQAIRRSIDKRK